MDQTKVEYVYEDENGQEFSIEEHTIQDHVVEAQTIEEVVIVQEQEEETNKIHVIEDSTHGNTEGDPDCRRRDPHHCWGVEQSKKLIETIKKFKSELSKPTVRRETWLRIHQDVQEKGLNVNVQECQNKWKNLVRSYKECTRMQNMNNMRFRYFKEMSEYFGLDSTTSDQDSKKSKLSLLPLLNNAGNNSTHGSTSNQANPTVTFPPICFTDRQFVEYTNMKREEYAARQKRHEEEMSIRKQELEIQKKKLEVMKKAAIANLPANKTINFDFPCRWPDEATALLISIICRRKYEIGDKDLARKTVLWNEITQEMNDNGFQVSVKETKSKWRNLIRSYNLRCQNQREKGFKFKFFNILRELFHETESLGIDPMEFAIENSSENKDNIK